MTRRTRTLALAHIATVAMSMTAAAAQGRNFALTPRVTPSSQANR
jgi:hypothetical protein